ncbi:hypothetical protein PIB30_051401 [Stylosanthes scabra]|uniref:Uncharacterized protein n=1 Tax=Stylosanthes scabra TaxID=79078 RepID=A0ABU6VJI5_9FABA|nr:hypothetical protein [Stylosanthes scabra]
MNWPGEPNLDPAGSFPSSRLGLDFFLQFSWPSFVVTRFGWNHRRSLSRSHMFRRFPVQPPEAEREVDQRGGMEDDEQDGAAEVTDGKNGSNRDVDEEQLRWHAVEW